VLAIVLGAAVGAVLVTSVGLAVPLALTAAIIVLLTIVYVAHPASKIEARRGADER
jgi:predicted MFS family arabinose efflux permease